MKVQYVHVFREVPGWIVVCRSRQNWSIVL